MEHMFPVVKNKRPHDVARFLRTFALEDRHEATNLLLTLGLQRLSEERQRQRASARIMSVEPLPGSADSDIVSLRFLRETAQSVRRQSRRPSPSPARSGSLEAGAVASQRTRSPRCIKCSQQQHQSSASPSPAGLHGGQATASPKHRREASPLIKVLIERDKLKYYAADTVVKREQLRSEKPPHTHTAPHHEVHFELVERKPAAQQTTSQDTAIVPSQEAAPSPPPAPSSQRSASYVSFLSDTAGTLPPPPASSLSHPICDSELFEARVVRQPEHHEPVVVDVAVAAHDMSAATQQWPPPTVPAEAVKALWSYVCDQRGARRNSLVVAAALPPHLSAVTLSPEFDQVYQSLTLSYHLQEQVSS